MKIKRGKIGCRVFLFMIAALVFSGVCAAAAQEGSVTPSEKRLIGNREKWEKTAEGYIAVAGRYKETVKAAALGQIEQEPVPSRMDYSFDAPVMNKVDDYYLIDIKEPGGSEALPYWTEIPGTPMIPVKPVKLLISEGREVEGIRVVPGELVDIEGSYGIMPSQKPVPIGQEPEKTLPDPEIYGSDEPYPAYPGGNMMEQKKSGYNIFFVNLCPVVYYPASGRVAYYKTLNIEVITKARAKEAPLKGKMGSIEIRPRKEAKKDIEEFVDNKDPAVIDSY